MSDLLDLQRRAADEFGRRVDTIGDDQWQNSTPCSEWDVRTLVNHLVYEDLWAPHLARGETIEQVGDRYEGDQLGADPRGTWKDAVSGALTAFREPGTLERTVHLSFGDVPGSEYLTQLAGDHLIHAWDLARGIGANDALDPELVDWAWETFLPMEPLLRGSGMFGEHIEVADDADQQTKLLGLMGRRR